MAKVYASEEIMKVATHALELPWRQRRNARIRHRKAVPGTRPIFLHMDATADISRLKIIKNMFPATAGKYAGPKSENGNPSGRPRLRARKRAAGKLT